LLLHNGSKSDMDLSFWGKNAAQGRYKSCATFFLSLLLLNVLIWHYFIIFIPPSFLPFILQDFCLSFSFRAYYVASSFYDYTSLASRS